LHAPATTELHPPSLHDALPICRAGVDVTPKQDIDWKIMLNGGAADPVEAGVVRRAVRLRRQHDADADGARRLLPVGDDIGHRRRSEEHTSELQSLTNLVCRLLL